MRKSWIGLVVVAGALMLTPAIASAGGRFNTVDRGTRYIGGSGGSERFWDASVGFWVGARCGGLRRRVVLRAGLFERRVRLRTRVRARLFLWQLRLQLVSPVLQAVLQADLSSLLRPGRVLSARLLRPSPGGLRAGRLPAGL